jgi:hypothetical protein
VSTPLHLRELRFIAFVAANLFFIGLFLVGASGRQEAAPGGWRRIDTGALKSRIEAGDLVDREAEWYHPAEEEERGTAPDNRMNP